VSLSINTGGVFMPAYTNYPPRPYYYYYGPYYYPAYGYSYYPYYGKPAGGLPSDYADILEVAIVTHLSQLAMGGMIRF
jgi:hypothetical protein